MGKPLDGKNVLFIEPKNSALTVSAPHLDSLAMEDLLDLERCVVGD